MTTPVFPVLPGQGWSVHKNPAFATIVAPHVSGREVRDALYVNPIWEFETSFDGMDSSSSSYPGLGAQSLQSLMGLFLQCQGQFGTFLYYDPTDYSVSGQVFGTGNGSTTSFQLLRTLGGFGEWVTQPLAASAWTSFSLPGSTFYAPNNIFPNSVNLASGFGDNALTATYSQTDPFGGTVAVQLTETATTAIHYATTAALSIGSGAGLPMAYSIYLKQSGSLRYFSFFTDVITGGPGGGAQVTVDLQNDVVTQLLPIGSATNLSTKVSAAGNGFTRYTVALTYPAGSSTIRGGVVGSNNSPTPALYPSYTGSTSNSLIVACPQIELLGATTPGAFNPTLSTLYYGGPSISVGGIYVDPSTYSISNGLVTFGSAPASGSIAWSGSFGFLCRFAQDDIDFEEFMQNLWSAKSVKFRSVRAQ